MKIVILNGGPEPGKLDGYIADLTERLEAGGHTVKIFRLRDMDIGGCVGCFNCWLKTPGSCMNPDDTDMIRWEYVHSDFIIYASPVVMGFISALLKNAIDRNIPLALPYLRAYKGEMHHILRYEPIRGFGVILEPGDDCDDEDLRIIRDIYIRNSLNLGTKMYFMETTDKNAEEVSNAINNI